MWNLAFLFIFILPADGKTSNLCRMKPPGCDGNKVIEVDVTRCVKPAIPDMWATSEMNIRQTCNRVNSCDLTNLMAELESCCGNDEHKVLRPKLRFAYSCVEVAGTTKAPPHMMPTTLSSPSMNAVTTKHMSNSPDIHNFCEINICQQKPYCSAGTEIAIMEIRGSLQADDVMTSLTYFCNKRQRCTEEYEPYVENQCKWEDNLKIQYVCMKEKVTTTVMCHYDEIIDNLEGQIRSSDYPNMIPASTSTCRIKMLFSEISVVELFLLDLPSMEVTYENEYREWTSLPNITRHQFIPEAHEVLLHVNFDKLPQRRIWMYYRVFPGITYFSGVQADLPWTKTCPNPMTTPEPMHITSKNIASSSETPKGSTLNLRSSSNANKDMPMMHKTDANQGIEELSTAPHIVIPDGIPVDTEVVEKIEPATFPVGPSTSSSGASGSSEGEVNPVEKPPNPTNNYGNREKASSASEIPTTGLYSREVVIGLIAGVVILACLVIILLTALFASMRRRRRSLADGEERDARHNSGPGGTTNENLVSFQYLKTFPTEGDNGTLGTRSQQSEDSIGGESATKKNLISKPIKKKNSLAPSENESNKTADTVSSKDDSVFQCLKNMDDYSNIQNESSKSVDSGLMTKNDNSFTGRSRLDADASKYTENPDGKGDDEVFPDVPHFYVNGDDYALVHKDSRRSPRSTLISDKSSIYANSSPIPKSGSSGSVQDSDVLEWTKGFNLAV